MKRLFDFLTKDDAIEPDLFIDRESVLLKNASYGQKAQELLNDEFFSLLMEQVESKAISMMCESDIVNGDDQLVRGRMLFEAIKGLSDTLSFIYKSGKCAQDELSNSRK